MIDRKILNEARDHLRLRAEEIDRSEFSEVARFKVSLAVLKCELERAQIREWLEEAGNAAPDGRAIYRIAATSDLCARRLFQKYERIRGRADFALARRNDAHEGRVIYVGSSRKIASRLFQHLRQAPLKTYALHLARWCPREDLDIEVEVQAPAESLSATAVQDIEDQLWDSSRPLFGRRGAR